MSLRLCTLCLLVGVIVTLCDSVSGRSSLDITPCPTSLSPSDDWSKFGLANVTRFILADASGPAKQDTQLHLCSTAESLLLKFDCSDKQIYNPFTKCNEDLYKWDVVEVFLAPASEAFPPHHYLELEVSPEGVLFAANVYNPELKCGAKDDLLPCESTGIVWQAKKMEAEHKWWAYLEVPYSLINSVVGGSPSTVAAQNQTLHGNFYRIDLPLHGDLKVEEFSCWNPTHTDPPCFHMPTYFGDLNVQRV